MSVRECLDRLLGGGRLGLPGGARFLARSRRAPALERQGCDAAIREQPVPAGTTTRSPDSPLAILVHFDARKAPDRHVVEASNGGSLRADSGKSSEWGNQGSRVG